MSKLSTEAGKLLTEAGLLTSSYKSLPSINHGGNQGTPTSPDFPSVSYLHLDQGTGEFNGPISTHNLLNSFSISAWVKSTSTGVNNSDYGTYFLNTHDNTGTYGTYNQRKGFQIQERGISSYNYIVFGEGSNAVYVTYNIANHRIGNGQWNHLLVVWHSNIINGWDGIGSITGPEFALGLRVYLNGSPMTVSSGYGTYTNNLNINTLHSGKYSLNNFAQNGGIDIDELAFWHNYALTPQEVTNIYNHGLNHLGFSTPGSTFTAPSTYYRVESSAPLREEGSYSNTATIINGTSIDY